MWSDVQTEAIPTESMYNIELSITNTSYPVAYEHTVDKRTCVNCNVYLCLVTLVLLARGPHSPTLPLQQSRQVCVTVCFVIRQWNSHTGLASKMQSPGVDVPLVVYNAGAA